LAKDGIFGGRGGELAGVQDAAAQNAGLLRVRGQLQFQEGEAAEDFYAAVRERRDSEPGRVVQEEREAEEGAAEHRAIRI
jgi:hypothetical protein